MSKKSHCFLVVIFFLQGACRQDLKEKKVFAENLDATLKIQSLDSGTPPERVLLDSGTSPEINAVPDYAAGKKNIIIKNGIRTISLVAPHKIAAKFSGTYFTNYTIAQGLTGNSVKSNTEYNSVKLWFTSDNSGVNCFSGQTFIHFAVEQSLSGNVIFSINMDDAGMHRFDSECEGLNSSYREINFYNDNGSVFEIPFLISNERTV